MAWPGTGFSVGFQGTGVHFTLTTDNVDYFQVVVDDQSSVLTTQAGTHMYDLAKGLALGHHNVTFLRRTEPLNGEVEVEGVTIDGGAVDPPLPNPGECWKWWVIRSAWASVWGAKHQPSLPLIRRKTTI